MGVLHTHHWPGNVRELRNFIQRAYILSDQTIDCQLLEPIPAHYRASAMTLSIPVSTSLADVDRKLIFATMELCGGVKKRAADLLGISLKTPYNSLGEYGPHEKNMIPLTTLPKRMPALIKQGDRVRITNGIFSST